MAFVVRTQLNDDNNHYTRMKQTPLTSRRCSIEPGSRSVPSKARNAGRITISSFSHNLTISKYISRPLVRIIARLFDAEKPLLFTLTVNSSQASAIQNFSSSFIFRCICSTSAFDDFIFIAILPIFPYRAELRGGGESNNYFRLGNFL